MITKCKLIKINNKKVVFDCNLRKYVIINFKQFKKHKIKLGVTKNFNFFIKKDLTENYKILINKYVCELNKSYIKKAYIKKKSIIGKITKQINGGFEVIYKTVKCFLPNYLIKKSFLNKQILKKKYLFKVHKITANKIILSKKYKCKFKLIKNTKPALAGIYSFYKKNKVDVSCKRLKLKKRKPEILFNIKKNKFFYKTQLFMLDNRYISWVNYFRYFTANIKKIRIGFFSIKKFKIFYKLCIDNPWKHFNKHYKLNKSLPVKFYKKTKNYLIFKSIFNTYLFSKKTKKIYLQYFIKYINYKKKIIYINNI